MDIYDQILENLELERELGTRTVEIDRALLLPPQLATGETPVVPVQSPVARAAQSATGETPVVPVQSPAARAAQSATGGTSVVPVPVPVARAVQSATDGTSVVPVPPPAAPVSSEGCDIAFLTGRPLSPAGAEAMTKTFAAMKRIKPDLRIALNESRKARVMILLGSEAAKKHLPPSMRPVRGLWLTHDGTQTLMTFSPDYIFSHFQAGSPHERQAKVEMWEDIKSALARLRG